MGYLKLARNVSNGFCAILAGLWVGAGIEAQAQAVSRHQAESALIESFHELAQKAARDEAAFREREIRCLTDVIIREAGGENFGERELVAMVYLARRDDKDPQWPKTICGITHQKGQVSGIEKTKQHERVEWIQNWAIAHDVYHFAWRKQRLPRGWQCVRYYKMSDEAIAKLTPKQRTQLGLSERGLAFFKTLRPIATRGVHTFYEDPKRCVTELPTT